MEIDPIARQLTKAREQRGWSQRDMAAAAGFSQPTINSWEVGYRRPRLKALRRWAAALGKHLILVDAPEADSPTGDRPASGGRSATR